MDARVANVPSNHRPMPIAPCSASCPPGEGAAGMFVMFRAAREVGLRSLQVPSSVGGLVAPDCVALASASRTRGAPGS